MGRGISLDELAKLNGINIPEEKPSKNNYTYNKKPQQKNYKPQNSRQNQSQNFRQPAKNATVTETATAPYNFVALPEKILPSEIASVENFKNHIQNCEKISGEIELEIKTLTPIFLGGNDEKSFAPAGQFIISGSSLRGMFKNIFKIVT